MKLRCIADIIPGKTKLPFARGPKVRRFGGEGSAQQLAFDFHKDAEKLEPYSPGDPTGFIHWPAFARTDQLLVKKKRPMIQKRVHIHFDCPVSMDWPGAEEVKSFTGFAEGYGLTDLRSKLETACLVSLDLCLRHLFHGDRVHLTVRCEAKTYDFLLTARAHGSLLFSSVWPWTSKADFFIALANASERLVGAEVKKHSFDREYIVQDFLTELVVSNHSATQRLYLGVGSQLDFMRDWSTKIPAKTVLAKSNAKSNRQLTRHARSVLMSQELQEKLTSWLLQQSKEASDIKALFHSLHEATPLDAYASMFLATRSDTGVQLA